MKPHSAKFMVDEHGANYFAWSIITDSFFTLPYTKKFIGAPFKSEIMLMRGEHGQWAPNIKNIRELTENVLKKIKSGTFRLDEIAKLHKTFGESVKTQARALEQLYKSQAPKAFAKTLLKIWNDFTHLNVVGFVIVWSDMEHGLLTKELEKILKEKKLPDSELQSVLSLLISPTEKIAPWEEKLALLKIAAKYPALKSALKSPELQQHIKKFKWEQYGYQGPELDEKYFAQELKKIYTASPKKLLEAHQNYFRGLKTRQQDWHKKLKLRPEESRIFETAKKIMYLKAYRVDVRHFFHWHMDKIFKSLGKKYHVPLFWFRYAQRSEIIKLIQTGKVATKTGLDRSKFLLRVTEGKKQRFIPQSKAEKFLKMMLIKEEIPQTSQLLGATAFPGIVKGRVKIVLSRNDIHKVQKGDILVATATNPDLLPAMYKASAFVTDAGGITSHAAIVAREMEKPCIIGTKIITKIFKDGDMVEVDANKGVIKKL